MQDTYDLVYSDEASATRYIYFKDSQNINIFVEDRDKEYEYEAILSKIMPDISFETLFASNGKQAMKDFFNEFGPYDVDNPSHPNIYIVDGDFDRIINSDEMILNDNFIYLDAYNIENYLLNEYGCITLCMGKLSQYFNKTKQIINYTGWFNRIVHEAKELFFIYCFLQKHHPSIKNVGNGPYIFIDQNTGFERIGALDSYKEQLKNLHGINVDANKERIDEIKSQYNTIYGDEYWRLICGKFLLTSLRNYLISKNVKPLTENDLRWWLISNIDISVFDFLADRINSIIGQYHTNIA